MDRYELVWANVGDISPQQTNDPKVFIAAYEVSSVTAPYSSRQQLYTQRLRNVPIYNNLWAFGEPKLDPDLGCVALDVSVTDPQKYGWHTVDCQASLPYVCSYLACQKNEFRCQDNSRCINETWVCDGVEDCPDSTDENGCAVECGPTYLTNLTGAIASPNYPRSHYPDDATCVWQILLPKQYKIHLKVGEVSQVMVSRDPWYLLQVTFFDTERFHDVLFAKEGFWEEPKDWDAVPETLVFNKSGALTNEWFQHKTATNSLLLKFVSDESITRPGFLINWEGDGKIMPESRFPNASMSVSNAQLSHFSARTVLVTAHESSCGH